MGFLAACSTYFTLMEQIDINFPADGWCALDDMGAICDASHALICQADSNTQDYRNCPGIDQLGWGDPWAAGDEWNTPEEVCYMQWRDCQDCGFVAPSIPLPAAAVRLAVYNLYHENPVRAAFIGQSLEQQTQRFEELVNILDGDITREEVATVICGNPENEASYAIDLCATLEFVGGSTTKNFNNAVDYCESLQPERKLATFENDAEFYEAQAECAGAGQDCWIGLKRNKNSPDWKWKDQDGSSSALTMANECPLPTKPSFWHNAEPRRSQSKSACAHLNKKKNFVLRDSGCGKNKRPLCRLL